MKVIFLIESPFNERDYNRFGIGVLQKNGFEVEVWDFTAFLNPERHRSARVPDLSHYAGYHQFLTQSEALIAISELTQLCLLVSLVGYRYGSFPIYRAISKFKLRYCIVLTNSSPQVSAIRSRIDLLTRPGRFLNSLFLRIPLNYLGLRPATLLLAGGHQSIRSTPLISQETDVIWAHTLDYDLYLEEKSKPLQADTSVAVFLDEYLPFHPDFINLGMSPPCNPEDYYPRVCQFFDFVEREHGVQILIAAHPRSHYEERPDYFGGRPVLKGKTVELVRKSRFVIAHSSISLNYAVLFNRPVLFITTNKIGQSPIQGRYIQVMAGVLNKAPVNLDEPFYLNWEKELTVDRAAYARYREAFIKKNGSPEKPCWQIFADFLKMLESQ
jgi:hypothetical protein